MQSTTYDRENIGDPNERDWHHPAAVVLWMAHTASGMGYVVRWQYPLPDAVWCRTAPGDWQRQAARMIGSH